MIDQKTKSRREILTGNSKPYTSTPNFPGLPDSLKAIPRWMIWKYHFKGGKWSKIPMNPHDPSRWGSHSDEGHRLDYATAMKMVATSGSFDGLKFVPGEEYTIFDLDDALYPDGSIKPVAKGFVEIANTYCEISPTGTGFKAIFGVPLEHLLGRTELHGIHHVESLVTKVDFPQQGFDCEILDGNKAACLTGYKLDGCPDEINSDPEAFFDAFFLLFEDTLTQAAEREKRHSSVGGKPAVTSRDVSTATILDKARNAANGKKFRALYDHGDTSGYGGDHSRADHALYARLAYWVGPDRERLLEMFKGSALFREEKRDRYHVVTIDKVLSGLAQVHDWTAPDEKLRWLDDLELGVADRERRGELPQACEYERCESGDSKATLRDPVAEILAAVKGGDGACERSVNDGAEGSLAEPTPDPYLDDLKKSGVLIGGKKLVKGSINYYTSCPCCGLVGTFWRRLEDFRCGYECSATRRSWAEGKALWKAVNGPEARKRRAFTLDELESLPSPGWLVQDHFAERSLVLIYGASNVGKSFYVIDVGLSVAADRSFLGRHAVRQGPVVYVVGEGAGGIRKRVKAWRKQHDVTADIPFLVIPYPFGLTTGEEEVTELVEIVRGKLGEVAPALIILDTLSRHFGPGDENATKDMKAFTDACDRLVAETGAAVLVVHHTGKDATRKERGNVTLRSNSDTVIFVDGFRGRDGMEVECQKQKDAEYFESYELLREVVTLDGGESSLVFHLSPKTAGVSRAARPTWVNDLEMVASLVPLGRDNARSIAQIVEDVRAGMVVCQMEPIGQNRCRTVVRSLIANGTLLTVPSTTGNQNHNRYYRADQPGETSDFFANPSHGEVAP